MRLRDQRPLHAGDDYVFTFTFVDENEDPVDITGGQIRFTAKFDVADADPGIIQKVGVIPTGTDGVFTITLTETDVVGPEFLRGRYDVQLTLSGTTETILSGHIEFLPNVSQTTP
jgi:hypothetical protein